MKQASRQQLEALRDQDSRIASADARVISVPTAPLVSSYDQVFPTVCMVILRLRDTDGAAGYGCLWCFELSEARVLVEMIRHLAPALTEPPATLSSIVAGIHRRISFLGFKGVTVFGLSAYDVALHDLLCRRAGASLSSLTGAARSSVPVYWSGLYLGESVAELKHEARQAIDRGFRAFKVRVGTPSLAEDERRVQAIVDELPADAALMLDSVQSWTPVEAIEAAHAMERYRPLWLEDPSAHRDYTGLRQVLEASPIPIATGENEYLREGFEQLLSMHVPYLLADVQRVGGILEWEAVAGAVAGSAALTPHVYPHIGIHLCAPLVGETWLEYISWWDPLMTHQLVIRDGHAHVPEAAGVGLDFADDALDFYALTPWERVGGRGA